MAAGRPAEEYRDPTAAEWAEFEQHFGARRGHRWSPRAARYQDILVLRLGYRAAR